MINKEDKKKIKEMFQNLIIIDRVKVKRETGEILQLVSILDGKITKKGIYKALIVYREEEQFIPDIIKDFIEGSGDVEKIKFIKDIENKWDLLYSINIKDDIDFLVEAEKFNGLGYRLKNININSPYVWSGSQYYHIGKFEIDGKFNKNLIDMQTGVAVLLKAINNLGFTE